MGAYTPRSQSGFPEEKRTCSFFSSQKYISEDVFDFGQSKNTLGMPKMVMWYNN
jgi:hypothetical protein